MASYVEEKASQLFARLTNSSGFFQLDKVLFPQLKSQDIIEIYGESGSGKTELLYHFIVCCILPHTWKGLVLEGLNSKVVFIDNDCHFDLLRLITIMETRLKSHRKQNCVNILSDEISIFIKERIKFLEITKCFDSEQFFVTLCSLETLLSFNNEKTLMMIDGMTSFYWSDKMRTQTAYKNLLNLYSQITKIIHKICKNYNIPILATRRKVINSEHVDRKILGQMWKSAVTYPLELAFKGSKPNETVLCLSNVSKGTIYECGISKNGFIINA